MDHSSQDDVQLNLGQESELPGAAPGKVLTPAARRALEEAQARREAEAVVARPAEEGGPAGPEPTRFGDWERKGIAVDF
jgi:hypothetical protein